MKCLSLVLSTLAVSSYVSALNYPILWWDQFNHNHPTETNTQINSFEVISALEIASKQSDLVVLLQDGLST